MKMKRFLAVLLAVTAFGCITTLTACKKENEDPVSISKDDRSTHYLILKKNGNEIFRMVVLETDTYESLRPFFPTIPEDEDDENSYAWPETARIWDDKELEMIVNADTIYK